MIQEKETVLLEILHKKPSVGRQRDLAHTIGLSLGMTNVLLKQLIHRGWVLAQHLSPRKIRYVLTPEGMKELTRRSYRYLKKTIQQIADYRINLTAFVRKQKARGYNGILLRGNSELAFLVEAVVKQEGMAYLYQPEDVPTEITGWMVVYSENIDHEPNLLTLVYDTGEQHA